jgi:lysyl-tRNA synthetase class I
MEMKDFFKLSYQAIIGKDRGPKLANFIIEIGKDRVSTIL